MLRRLKSSKIQRYKKIRETGRELAGKMLSVIPPEILKRTAKDMNILHKGTFVFDSEEEMSFLQDRTMYDVPWDGKNAVEHFEARKGSDLSVEEKKVLEGMKGAYFSLFEIVGRTRGMSVQLFDLLSNEHIELTDVSMSRSARKGTILAARVLKVENMYMTSGSIYPFGPEQKDILISGLKTQQIVRRGRKKQSARRVDVRDPKNYSLYFFKQYRKLSPMEVRMSEE